MLMIASIFISMISFSQTIKENIEKLSKDPRTIENSAKADVYIPGNKKKISDTVQVVNSNPISKTSRKKKQRRKS